MVDPDDVTHFNRTLSELEEFFLFAYFVAGKKATVIAKKLEEFLSDPDLSMQDGNTPFERIQELASGDEDALESHLKKHGMGKYSVSVYGISHAAYSLHLPTATLKDLESISGVGPKTARFFLMHSRPNQRLACLDTHILRYMREELDIPTPKTTPSGKKYLELEKKWLAHCDEIKRDPAELDLEVWVKYANKQK